MTIIRVNPASVHAYGNDAQEKFNLIREELVALVAATVEVRYFGPNAVDFKTRAGELAANFANDLNRDLGAIADAIRTSTSNIAASLGGQPVNISVNGAPITPPAVASVDFVDVDTAALQGLTATVNRHFASIGSLFDQHLSKLQGTDWEGNARNEAEGQVTRFTSSAKAKCEEAQNQLNTFIENQVNAVVTADH